MKAPEASRPATIKELFNLRPSSARNFIERTYGRLKKKFRILKVGCTLPMDRQADVIYACCALLNYMALQRERFEAEQDEEEDNDPERDRTGDAVRVVRERIARAVERTGGVNMARERDRLGKKMWRQYASYRRANGGSGM